MMNREFLEGLGLEKDAINAIMAKHGSAIGGKETEITNLNNEKQKLNEKITQLENAGSDDDDDDAKNTIAQLKADKKKLEENHEAELKSLRVTHAAEKEIIEANALDLTSVLAHVDLSEFDLDENGKVQGLAEKLETLKEEKAFLFEAGEPKEPGKPKAWSQGNSTVEDVEKNPFSKEHFNLTEQGKLYREDPDLYKSLKAQAGK